VPILAIAGLAALIDSTPGGVDAADAAPSLDLLAALAAVHRQQPRSHTETNELAQHRQNHFLTSISLLRLGGPVDLGPRPLDVV
jgi:hypothetical protein